MPEKKKGNRARLPRDLRRLLRFEPREFAADPKAFALLGDWTELDDRCARLHAAATVSVRRAAALRALSAARLRERRPGDAVRRMHAEVREGRIGQLEERGLEPLTWLHDVAAIFRRLPAESRDGGLPLRLLAAVAERGRLLQSRDPEVREALWNLASCAAPWLREPEDWRPARRGLTAQVESLAAHLYARYPVPVCFEGVWSRDSRRERHWYREMGSGASIRKARHLPYPVSKRAVKFFVRAPRRLRPTQALRYAQVRGLGGTEQQATALATTRLGWRPNGNEEFWLSFTQWIVRHPELSPRHYHGLVAWADDRRHSLEPGVDGPLQPNLSFRGRTAERTLREVARWREELARDEDFSAAVWREPSDCTEWRHSIEAGCNELEYQVASLNSARALEDEGRRMKHCVGSYAEDCVSGKCTILSLRKTQLILPGNQRLATIELRKGVVVQVQGPCNDEPSREALGILMLWCMERRLTFEQHLRERYFGR